MSSRKDEKAEIINALTNPAKAPFRVAFELFASPNREAIAHFKSSQNQSKNEVLDNYAENILKRKQKHEERYKNLKKYLEDKIQELGLKNPLVFFDDKALRIDIGYGPKEFDALFHDFIVGIFMKTLHDDASLFGPSPYTYLAGHMHADYTASLAEEEKQIKNKAATEFKKPLPAKLKPDLSKANDEPSLINACLQTNQGMVIGEKHEEKSPKQFLIDNMAALKAQGVSTLYLEHVLYDRHQALLDAYVRSPADAPMPKILELYLKHLDNERDLKDPASFMGIVKAAKQNGIRIVAIDTEATYRIGVAHEFADIYNDEENSKNRYTAMNMAMLERFRENNDGKKYVAFVGSGHVSTIKGVPGVSDLLGVPNIVIHDVNPEKQEKIEQNVRFQPNETVDVNFDIMYDRNPNPKNQAKPSFQATQEQLLEKTARTQARINEAEKRIREIVDEAAEKKSADAATLLTLLSTSALLEMRDVEKATAWETPIEVWNSIQQVLTSHFQSNALKDKDVAKQINYWIDVAKKALEKGDVATSTAIMGGLYSAAVSTREFTVPAERKAAINEALENLKSPLKETYLLLKSLLTSNQNVKDYHAKIFSYLVSPHPAVYSKRIATSTEGALTAQLNLKTAEDSLEAFGEVYLQKILDILNRPDVIKLTKDQKIAMLENEKANIFKDDKSIVASHALYKDFIAISVEGNFKNVQDLKKFKENLEKELPERKKHNDLIFGELENVRERAREYQRQAWLPLDTQFIKLVRQLAEYRSKNEKNKSDKTTKINEVFDIVTKGDSTIKKLNDLTAWLEANQAWKSSKFYATAKDFLIILDPMSVFESVAVLRDQITQKQSLESQVKALAKAEAKKLEEQQTQEKKLKEEQNAAPKAPSDAPSSNKEEEKQQPNHPNILFAAIDELLSKVEPPNEKSLRTLQDEARKSISAHDPKVIENILGNEKQRELFQGEDLARLLDAYNVILEYETNRCTRNTLLATMKHPEMKAHIAKELSQLSDYIVYDILREKDINNRILVVERYIQMMYKANNHMDYLTVAAIFNAIQNDTISTLGATFTGVPRSSIDVLNELNDRLTRGEANFKHPLTASNVQELMKAARESKSIIASSDSPFLDNVRKHAALSEQERETLRTSAWAEIDEVKNKNIPIPDFMNKNPIGPFFEKDLEKLNQLPLDEMKNNRKANIQGIEATTAKIWALNNSLTLFNSQLSKFSERATNLVKDVEKITASPAA